MGNKISQPSHLNHFWIDLLSRAPFFLMWSHIAELLLWISAWVHLASCLVLYGQKNDMAL